MLRIICHFSAALISLFLALSSFLISFDFFCVPLSGFLFSLLYLGYPEYLFYLLLCLELDFWVYVLIFAHNWLHILTSVFVFAFGLGWILASQHMCTPCFTALFQCSFVYLIHRVPFCALLLCQRQSVLPCWLCRAFWFLFKKKNLDL